MRQRAKTTATDAFAATVRLPAPTLETAEISVAAPPPRRSPPRTGSLIRVLPVVSAVAMIAVTAVVARSGAGMARTPMMVGFPLMMLVSATVTVLAGRGRQPTAEIDSDRADYLGYLTVLRHRVTESAAAQRDSMLWCHPPPDTLWALAGGPRMWERRPADPDFADVRIGLGDRPRAARLVAPESGPADRSDPVTATALRRFLAAHSTVPDVPITIALPALRAVTFTGDPQHIRAVLRAMICQLAVLHAPHLLLIVAAVGEDGWAHWDWLKWLPHNRHPDTADAVGPARMVYPSLAETDNALAGMLADRPLRQPASGSAQAPQIVVVVDGGVVEGSERILTAGGLAGVTVVQAGPGCDRITADCGLRLRVTPRGLTATTADGEQVPARPDRMSLTDALVCARRLAAYRAGGPGADPTSPGDTGPRWQDLLGIADPAGFDPAARWRGVARRDRLRVPIGTTAAGSPLELDIKEAAEGGIGPHGLCVGATGSGKSELLRTVVLGLMAGHSPQVLNLVLVDFKGGATFLGLQRSPHVAALITNLAAEEALVARMTDALTGEMNRRQEVLRAAGNVVSLAAYERAREAGAALAALPVLFIVVDEFSELLSRHPDFADVFSAIGRVGRSLGMHLLLASQRLDEAGLRGLESHISYRMCLKTLSAHESRTVLGVPDAYELPNTPGAGYLRSATGELTRFQAACVSGPCPVPDTADGPAERDCSRPPAVEVFTAAPVGPLVPAAAGTRATRAGSTSASTVMAAVVARLAGQGPAAHRVWLPPLDAAPTLEGLLGDLRPGRGPNRALTVPIGIVDRPFDQRHTPLLVDVSGAAGNVAVVGAPQSGKSTALRTLITALAATHDPGRVQFYCLDFGGGALAGVRALPHVGSVAGRAEPELVTRTVSELDRLVRARDMLFRAHGIESMTQYRGVRARGDPISDCDRFGDVFLVVDGWATLRDEFDGLEGPITTLAVQGLSFGVHVVLSASRWAEIRPALKDQLGTRVELRLGDPADSALDRKRAVQVPENRPGRGLSSAGLHMMIALPRLDGDTAGKLVRRDGEPAAPAIPLLPAQVDLKTVVAGDGGGSRILLGLSERDLAPLALDFARHGHLLILGESECGKTTALRTVCREVVRTAAPAQAQLLIVDFRRGLLGVVESEHLCGYAMSAAALSTLLPARLAVLGRRLPGSEVTAAQLRTRSWWSGPDIYVVVDDYDLVAAAAGDPLTPLLQYLPHAADVGLHLVVARRSAGAARAMFEPLPAALRELGAMGLIMSADPADGPLIGSVAPEALPPGRGTLITRTGGEQQVQVAWSPPP